MSAKPDGGPAFPRPLSKLTSEEVSPDQDGMSLRDYFAAKAMASLIGNGYEIPSVVSRAYALADALLAERAQ